MEPALGDTHITWLSASRPAVSYQSSGTATASGGNTPATLTGQGQKAIRRRPIGGLGSSGL